MDISEAQALLSASESWVDQAPSGLYETRAKMGQSWNAETQKLPLDREVNAPIGKRSDQEVDRTKDADYDSK